MIVSPLGKKALAEMSEKMKASMYTVPVSPPIQYEYHINLDERGEFSSDVRHPDTEASIFEIDTDKITELVEDGYIKHSNDIDNISGYLYTLGIININDSIISAY